MLHLLHTTTTPNARVDRRPLVVEVVRVEDRLEDVLELFGRYRADEAHEDGDEADGAETTLVNEVRIVLVGSVFRLTKGNDAARVNPVHLDRAEP